MNRKIRAFTLIELMVVILILAILAALIVPNVLGRTGQAKVSKATADLATLSNAIDQFRLDCDRYPTTQEGLDALLNAPSGATGWRGPYLKQAIPNDPWGAPYQYSCPGPGGGGYQVESYGGDGQPGGTGDNADLVNGSET
ncbi:MAG: type II secretion system major pseudopilin GspG [Fimbriimonas sp.]|nr:type II secretion system major pseudopilin GspG [Fimbriimonas sp.]